jgi:hypothetical protein
MPLTDEETSQLYNPTIGDADQNSYADIFGGPGNLLGFGNGAKNADINKREAIAGRIQAENAKKRAGIVDQTVQGNNADWANLVNSIYGPGGVGGSGLSDFYSGVEGKDQAALGDLTKSLGNYKDSANFFQDPNFMGTVADIENKAQIDPSTLAAQKSALSQFGAMTKPTESAEEKFMRMMAQREAESNQRGDREAMASRLKSRGAYGSGQELVSALMSQGQNSQNRSLANAAANANASKRAAAALGSYADVANQMGSQQLQAGSLANQAQMFNKGSKQSAQNARAAAQIAATQAGQNAQAQRAGATYTANQGVNNNVRGDKAAQNSTGMNVTQGMTGNRTQGAGLGIGESKDEDANLKSQQATWEASRPSGGIF